MISVHKRVKNSRYFFYFYVPNTHKEKVKKACFATGAGTIGNYSHCSFEYVGKGQFLAHEGSDPFIGKKSKLTSVKEVKVEMIVEKKNIKQLMINFLKTHPYEEPAYGFISMETAEGILDKKR